MSKELVEDIFQWDVKNWSNAIGLWERHVSKQDQTALAIGEREGGLSLWLAKKDIKVVCTDLNDLPKETYQLHKDHNVAYNITYKKIDMTNIRFEDNSFDIVVFKSVLGALETKERQQQAVNEIHRVLKPGGKLLFAENLEGSKMHKKIRKRYVKWTTYWRYLNVKNDLDLFQAFGEREFQTFGFWGCFGRSEGQRRFLSIFDSVFARTIPRKWNYILFGACTKK